MWMFSCTLTEACIVTQHQRYLSTHHVEVDEAILVLRAFEQGTALTSHGVPRAVEVICHDVDHIQSPGCCKQEDVTMATLTSVDE